MGKYSPLKKFLVGQDQDRVPMTFAEIEKVLDFKLPASKQYPAWWSNNPSNNPMTKEWLDAGYETESVNTASGKLIFRRIRKGRPMRGEGGGASHAPQPPRGRHPGFGFMEGQMAFPADSDDENQEYIVPPKSADPLFGCLAGTLTLLPDVDYTAPAYPDWGRVYDD